ncbi:unnamed protein product, partial [marine sediment metagenome]
MKNTTQVKTGPVKVRKVEIELPEALCDLVERICKVQERSIHEYVIDCLVEGIKENLSDFMGAQMGIGTAIGDYGYECEE